MQYSIKHNRIPGISFITRCHNEEDTISSSILSLQNLKIPYEVIVILHRCSDRSEEIVNNLSKDNPITILKYDKKVSRAGFETLITPKDHPNSIVTYCNYCFSNANYNWLFKWDADFIATDNLISFLNSLSADEIQKIVFKIKCDLGDHVTSEHYLSNCLVKFIKYHFWEVGLFENQSQFIDGPNDVIIKSVPRNNLKCYWNNNSWFEEEDTKDLDLINKKVILESLVGKEPKGFGACCYGGKEYEAVQYNVLSISNELSKHGIFLYE